ncbi:MAG: response regulator [Acidobacteria bacterium]|nr:response regulator [Acidobacteriota bacterium]MBI3422096.1 response regulator [Acidobacteriota bacterium]
MPKQLILLAENNDEFREQVVALLEEHGYEVAQATSPGQAREIAQQRQHELALAVFDVRLNDDRQSHDFSGLLLAETTCQKLPKVIMSSFSDDPDTYFEITRRLTEIAQKSYPATVRFLDKQKISPNLDGHSVNGKGLIDEIRSALDETAQTEQQQQEQADQKVRALFSKELITEVRGAIADELKGTLRSEPLDNYEGFIVASLHSQGKELSPQGKERILALEAGAACELQVQLLSERPATGMAEAVLIRGGQTVDEPTFDLEIEIESSFPDAIRKSVKAPADKPSEIIELPFTAPVETGEHDASVGVYQKNRLIQYLSFTIQIA